MTDAAIPSEEETSTVRLDVRNGFPFSIAAFLQGLGGIVFLLLVFVLWAMLRTDAAYELHQDKLASKTVIIEYPIEVVETSPIAEKSADALAEAPIDGLFEDGEFGLLPIKRKSDGLKPFDAYKKPFEAVPGRPMVSLVITDMGLSQSVTHGIMRAFPSTVSLSLSPYAKKGESLGQLARASGHEIWMGLPLETSDFGESDPGPRAILRNASLEQNSAHILWLLAQLQGYAGVILPEDHVFLTDTTDINNILDELIGRGLAIVEMNELGSPDISAKTYEQDSPYDVSDFVLDPVLNSREIAQKFKALELRAMKNGKAIGFMRPHPLSIQVAERWIASLDDKGVQLAPLSAVIE